MDLRILKSCGKMDPVPNVPFTDWGYSRYGITYYTPTMETDSDFWEKREKADKIYEDITGISYWANADMNNQLRVLIDCLLTVCPDVETYAGCLQKYLISLWEKHDVISTMPRLLEMAEDPVLINDENRLEANVMMNQIAYMLLAGADIIMTTNVTAGTVLQIGVFVLLCVNFIRVDKPGLFRTLVWIIMSAGVIWLMTKVTGHSGYQWYLETAYIVSGAALVVSAFTYSARSSRGSVLLFASGILMILNTALGSNIWISFVSAALYYIGVCILASMGSGFIIPRISSEYETQPEKEPAVI